MDEATFVPAEAFSPGEYIKDELEARGWSQADLAEVLGTSAKLVSDVVGGKCSITPETAHGLSQAFGTSAQLWMNLDSAYRLWRLRPKDDIARRARLFSKGPLKEMHRRGWIEPDKSLDVLETRVASFYGLSSIDESPQFSYAARKSTPYGSTTPAQLAWLFRSRMLARGISVAPFSTSSVADAIAMLRPLMANAQDTRHVPRVLAEHGIRLVCVEGLTGTKVDAATFWLDDRSPVISISFRFDRIDWFWFTLLHELDHVANNEESLDVDLVGKDAEPSDVKPAEEQRADAWAANTLVPRTKLQSFVARVDPLFSKVRIVGFAAVLGVHPGIAVGQLQRAKAISYAHSRDLLVKVCSIVLTSALTDGWGEQVRL